MLEVYRLGPKLPEKGSAVVKAMKAALVITPVDRAKGDLAFLCRRMYIVCVRRAFLTDAAYVRLTPTQIAD
eukprot:11234020-Prorocentrum_lima.AAC.1